MQNPAPIAVSSPAKPEAGARPAFRGAPLRSWNVAEILRTRRARDPDWIDSRLHGESAEDIARSLRDDPWRDPDERNNRLYIAIAIVSTVVSCALPFIFALTTLPIGGK